MKAFYRIRNQPRSLHILLYGVILGVAISIVTEYLTQTTLLSLCNEEVYEIHQEPQLCDIHNRSYSQLTPKLHIYEEMMMNESKTFMDYGNIISPLPLKMDLLQSHSGESNLSDSMREGIRILCWVMTHPKTHVTQALSVRATWGKRCNIFYFVSTEPVKLPQDARNTSWDQGPPLVTVVYKGKESRNTLWGKTKMGFRYAYEHYFDQADWFVKADDDTYLILENLRLLLLDKDPAQPVYYGCRYRPLIRPNGYMSGGAGYVLSKEALKRLVEVALPKRNLCWSQDSGAEDVNMGNCLQNVGVKPGNNQDSDGLMRFFPFTPESHVIPQDSTHWFWSYMWFVHEMGVECCSNSAIAFHYVDKTLIWTLEYLIYHLHPFGIHSRLTGSEVKEEIELYLKNKTPCNVTKTKSLVQWSYNNWFNH